MEFDPDIVLTQLRENFSEEELYSLGLAIFREMPPDWQAQAIGDYADDEVMREFITGYSGEDIGHFFNELGLDICSKKKFKKKLAALVRLAQDLEEDS